MIVERIFCVIIVAAGLYGLLEHNHFDQRRQRLNFFMYYTNLSNILVVLYHIALLAAGLIRFRSGVMDSFYSNFLKNATVEISVSACILVTNLVFHFLLRPSGRKMGWRLRDFGIWFAQNLFVHYLVPLLTLAEWIWLGDKAGLRWYSPLLWLCLPLAYMAYILIRAGLIKKHAEILRPWEKPEIILYPYPFMDLDKLGMKKFIINMIMLLIAFVMIGYLFVAAGRILTIWM